MNHFQERDQTIKTRAQVIAHYPHSLKSEKNLLKIKDQAPHIPQDQSQGSIGE